MPFVVSSCCLFLCSLLYSSTVLSCEEILFFLSLPEHYFCIMRMLMLLFQLCSAHLPCIQATWYRTSALGMVSSIACSWIWVTVSFPRSGLLLYAAPFIYVTIFSLISSLLKSTYLQHSANLSSAVMKSSLFAFYSWCFIIASNPDTLAWRKSQRIIDYSSFWGMLSCHCKPRENS